MRLLSIQTPQLLSSYDRRFRFLNYNSLIKDVDEFEAERKAAILWSDKEKQIFREKFTQFPKDFDKIASFLEQKKCSDCVLFYYRNKKKEGFKSSKMKSKKKGKLNRNVNQLTMRIEHGKSKQSKSEKEEEDEGNDSTISDDETAENSQVKQVSSGNTDVPIIKKACTLTTCTIESSTKTLINITDKLDCQQNQGLETKSISDKSAMVLDLNDASKVHKSPQPLVKVFNTRSGKLSQKTAKLSIMSEDAKISEDVRRCEVQSSDVFHPPLKIIIAVTSPSYNDLNTTVVPACSIISETITAAVMVNVPDEVPFETVVKVEDLIRQHFSMMPGLILICTLENMYLFHH